MPKNRKTLSTRERGNPVLAATYSGCFSALVYAITALI
jgi:hypothetical protein